jgi:hypothetical protein
MTEPIVFASRNGYEKNSDQSFDGECPNCSKQMDLPNAGDIHIDIGEFIAITRRCSCGLAVESFYDWDRTEKED